MFFSILRSNKDKTFECLINANKPLKAEENRDNKHVTISKVHLPLGDVCIETL